MTPRRAFSCCLVCGGCRILRTVVDETETEWIVLNEQGRPYPLSKAAWAREAA